MIARFHNPVDTRLGYNSLVELASITENQKVALVIFPEARGLRLVDRIQDLLGERLIYIVEDVQPNPDVAQLRGTYERFWQEAGDCQTVIAVGGGSAIDTAKALIVGTQSGRFDELVALLATGKPFVPAHSKALIAVPTTAGTGSEVTP
ncbi:UNVERIFIED_ORG: alcohol dehydrogenase class IV [Pseudomonas mohnii]|jgi:alcohol dehydrogenase class IV|nr:alcohol dehydrogenase class IV [Pseudomonas mohnii]